MEWITLAAISMVCAVLAQHLGLTEAMAKIMGKVVGQIASCYKCCAFWVTMFVLALGGASILIAVALSIFMAYLSHYVALALAAMHKLYDKLWQRITK